MLIALLSVSLCGIVSATTWDLNTDKSITDNDPNGIWTYGYGVGDPNNPDPNAIPTYEGLMVKLAEGVWIMSPTDELPYGVFAPHIWFELMGVPDGWHGVKPGWKNFGPAADDPNAQATGLFRWTAPAAFATPSVISIAVSIYPPDPVSSGEVYIVKSVAGDPTQRTVLLHQKNVTLAAPVAFTGSTNVTAGDTIDFMVGPYERPDPINDPLYQSDWYAASVTIYDYLPAVCQTQLPMDFNWDCYVNLEDFALFAQSWLDCNDQSNPSCDK